MTDSEVEPSTGALVSACLDQACCKYPACDCHTVASPKPADAIRERDKERPIIVHCIGVLIEKFGADSLEAAWAIFDYLGQPKSLAALSAPVPSPDGVDITLQARNAEGGDWFEIEPEQLEWMAKNGHDVRALYPVELRRSLSPSDDVRSALADRIDQAVVLSVIEPCYKGHVFPASANPLSENEKNAVVAALRSAPVSAPATDVAEIIKTLRNPGPRVRGYAEFFNKAADALERLSVPTVEVTREAIEFLTSARANAYSQQGGKLFSGFTVAEDFHALAGDILALPPAPDATVSEPVAWRWRYESEPWPPWLLSNDPIDGDKIPGLIIEPLYTSPQDVDIQTAAEIEHDRLAAKSAAVSARDAVIEQAVDFVKSWHMEDINSRERPFDSSIFQRDARMAEGLRHFLRSLASGARP